MQVREEKVSPRPEQEQYRPPRPGGAPVVRGQSSSSRTSTWVDRGLRSERALRTLEGLHLNDGSVPDGTWGRVLVLGDQDIGQHRGHSR